MAVSDLADEYFAAKSILYSDVETSLCKFIPSVLFDNEKIVEYRTIAIPDNSTNNFYMYNFGPNEFVQSLYNIRIGRLEYPEEFIFNQTSAYTTVTTFANTEEVPLGVAIHGDGIVFDTEDDARNVIIEIGYTDKSRTKLIKEVRDVLKLCYYYLYVDDLNGYYNYLRRLGIEKNNTRAENTKVKSTRKISYSQLTPTEL